MTNLSDNAVIVQLSISQWTARKYDRKLSKDVADANGATADVGRYNKLLLPANDALKNVHSKTQLIRGKFYENTLPWGLEGQQILPTGNYLAFMSEFRKEHSEWNYLVNQFITAYPALKASAKTMLPGSMYNEDDYPDASTIYNKFKMDLAVFPVPTTDFRVQLSDIEMQHVQNDVEQRVKQAAQNAMHDVWQRLFDKVKHIADKLADPKAIFRDSMIENAREMCELLPRLNFTSDPALEQLRQDVETKLAGYHPDALRNDPDVRRNVAAEAQKIMDTMKGIMGG